MSCQSTTGSIETSDTAIGPSPGFGWFWKIPLELLDGLERRRQYRELLELDDRLLADMGVSRTTIAEARSSSFSGWRDSR